MWVNCDGKRVLSIYVKIRIVVGGGLAKETPSRIIDIYTSKSFKEIF